MQEIVAEILVEENGYGNSAEKGFWNPPAS